MEKKQLTVQLGYIETEKEYFDFIAFDDEYWNLKREIYRRCNDGLHYIDDYYFDDDVKVENEYNFGKFSVDDYEQITHQIICLADDKGELTMKDIKTLIKNYKNDN